MNGEPTVLLADMNSFYASVEVAHNPALREQPVLVCGDPERRHGIILAASRQAKSRGVKTAMTVGEARAICPDAVCVRPRMSLYMEVSWQIQQIARTLSPLVEPYSVDELFIDVRGAEHIWGGAVQAARVFRQKVWETVKVPCSIGIGPNKFLAKMACDIEAKKSPSGVALWREEHVEAKLHPLPTGKMFMVGSRMERHFRDMGLLTIGELAHYPPHYLTRRFGLRGHVYHNLAWGRDPSPVCSNSFEQVKSVGHSITLPRDYHRSEDIELILLELTDEVCRRARKLGKAGKTVSVGLRAYDLTRGFYRQTALACPSNLSGPVFEKAQVLFRRYWDGRPVRTVTVDLSGLEEDGALQQELFRDMDRQDRVSRTMDHIRDALGTTAVVRASSLLPAGQAQDRALKIGGHYR
ncbi:DNA polymerase IV [Heliobacterium gestii]|uniref:DNA polymerase IV n=1 Tax=Heliomicrobium gestii TaxID=2699 RepID=A0A845LKC8_HELGE|nr:DNA polymerase IV [Heliomicrobium gestii]MBM7867299.1 nucleotidyltransferase/DNA polymerase involved in DNA repair [Heliomicrobium gestii]MZP43853.1 DNA polymerase IV [Heliomicrobium gestii]